MDEFEIAFEEYHAAMLENKKLADQETIIRLQREKARKRLSLAKAALFGIEQDLRENINLKTT